MKKNIDNYKEIYNNISTPILIMEGQYFIYANSCAIELFDMDFEDDILFLHSSQISAKYQPDGQKSITKLNQMIAECLKKGEHTFSWQANTLSGNFFLIEVNLKENKYK